MSTDSGIEWIKEADQRRAYLREDGRPARLDVLLAAEVEFYRGLSEADQFRFRGMIRVFLDEIRIAGEDTTVDDRLRVLIAAHAVIAVFGFREWEYGFDTVIVHPGPVTPSADGMADYGARRIHLSKKRLLHGFNDPRDGDNVAIHEVAHFIDASDHRVDGMPMTLPGVRDSWRRLMDAALEAPEGAHILMDPYGFTNEAEFFACLSESFFDTPAKLEEENPRLFEHLKWLYQQDPKEVLMRARDKKGGRRARKRSRITCPCGSGEKYKQCCWSDTAGLVAEILR